MPNRCRKLAVQRSLSLEEEMKMRMRTWMSTKACRICPQKPLMTRLQTAVRCQARRVTATQTWTWIVTQSPKIELTDKKIQEVMESQEEQEEL